MGLATAMVGGGEKDDVHQVVTQDKIEQKRGGY
jgi:hypothetical protein